MESIHGGDIWRYPEHSDLLDFSANLNPLGMPGEVMDAARKSLEMAQHYPEPWSRSLRRSIAEYETKNSGGSLTLGPENIVCGSGAAELIFLLCRALGSAQGICLAPSFTEYERALEAAGSRLLRIRLLEQEGFCVTRRCIDEIAAAQMLPGEKQILFLCLPNNPDGNLIRTDELEEILQLCRRRGIWLVLDACFASLCSEEDSLACRRMAERCLSFERCIVLKAFTKSFAMPGLRLGYLLCSNERLVRAICRQMQPWNVSVPAQAAGMAALGEKGFLQKSRSYIAREKEYLLREMGAFLPAGGGRIFGHAANYIFFRAGSVQDLGSQLLERGILIRDCSSYPGLKAGYYRIAVRTRGENRRLVRAMQDIYKVR